MFRQTILERFFLYRHGRSRYVYFRMFLRPRPGNWSDGFGIAYRIREGSHKASSLESVCPDELL